MESRKFENTYYIRLEKGEEVLTQLMKLCEKENILLGHISGIGAVDHFTIGIFDTVKKEYKANTFDRAAEITSLLGTVTEQEGKPYLHLHMNAGMEDGSVVGGHLNEARISATGEIVLVTEKGCVGRRKDAETGLNLFAFPEE